MSSVFILVPALVPTGPIKGAIALANALSSLKKVFLVSLREAEGAHSYVDSRVSYICLASHGHRLDRRVVAYRNLLRGAGSRASVISISMCLSADMVNWFCKREAIVVSSVRGNLPVNYRLDYGWPGTLLAALHLFSLRRFDWVVAMTQSMAQQIRPYLGACPAVVGNFVDEMSLESFRHEGKKTGPLKFVFLASLSSRKQPMTLLDAVIKLKRAGHSFTLDVIGYGPLAKSCHEYVRRHNIQDIVTFHGQLGNPYVVLADADVLVVPSLSEGVSRASLEALFLGVPCVLRDVDGNSELITSGVNGTLFAQDSELPSAILSAAALSRNSNCNGSLLPPTFRQDLCALQYLNLVEGGND